MTFCSNLVPGYDIVVEWSHRVHSTWWFERDTTGWAWQWGGWYVAFGYSHTAQTDFRGGRKSSRRGMNAADSVESISGSGTESNDPPLRGIRNLVTVVNRGY